MQARVERRRELPASDVTDGELRRRLRARELVVVRRGAYLTAGAVAKGPEARPALRLRAAHRDPAPDAVVSHVSAAVLHGLPVWAVPLGRIHVTRPRRAGARRSAALHVHAAPLDPEERVEIDGVTVTSGAHRRVPAATDALSESVGGSRSRDAFWLAGLPSAPRDTGWSAGPGPTSSPSPRPPTASAAPPPPPPPPPGRRATSHPVFAPRTRRAGCEVTGRGARSAATRRG